MLERIFSLLCVLALCGLMLQGAAAAQTVQMQVAGSAQPAPLTGLDPDHATISVENMGTERNWYERVLGFRVSRVFDTNPDFVNVQLSLPGGYRIDLIKFKGSSRPAPVDPRYLEQGWVHIAFSVPDLTAAWKALQDHKTDVAADKDASGVPTRLVVHDPEGNEIELFNRPK